MKRVDDDFNKRVYDLVGKIPRGRVMTYGQIAAYCGAAWAAWEVGQIAHTGPTDLPWQRVVNKKGGLARGYTNGGLEKHKIDLESDGIFVEKDYTVKIAELIWAPND
jgi:methylated-DNA-protein-cysteine methyltransferase related protein